MLIGLWVPAAINLSGVKNMGAIQIVTTVLKFAALAFMSTVGLFFINTANYSPFNVSGQGAVAAIGAGMAIALFSYLGVETAAVAAGKVSWTQPLTVTGRLKSLPSNCLLGHLSLWCIDGRVSLTDERG